MSEDSDNPFWHYSLALYGRAAVAGACLELQDRRGLDVNLLLFCCWAGAKGRRLSEAEISDLIEAARPWREAVVLPLRAARRWLKAEAPGIGPAAHALRAEVKASELSAEAVQQNIMHKRLPLARGRPSGAAIAANLRAYLALLGTDTGAAEAEALATLLRGACPKLPAAEARRLLADRA